MTGKSLEQLLKRQNTLSLFFKVIDDGIAAPSLKHSLQRDDVVSFNKDVLKTIFKRVQHEITDERAEALIRSGNKVFARHPASQALLFAVAHYVAATRRSDYLLIGRENKAFRVMFSPEGRQRLSYSDEGQYKKLTFPMGTLCLRFSRNGRVGSLLTTDYYQFPVTLEGAEALAGRLFPSDLRSAFFASQDAANAALVEKNNPVVAQSVTSAQVAQAYRTQMPLPFVGGKIIDTYAK